jgi:hypothetical protein
VETRPVCRGRRGAGVENWQGKKFSSFFMIFATPWRRVWMGGNCIGGHAALSLNEKSSSKM